MGKATEISWLKAVILTLPMLHNCSMLLENQRLSSFLSSFSFPTLSLFSQPIISESLQNDTRVLNHFGQRVLFWPEAEFQPQFQPSEPVNALIFCLRIMTVWNLSAHFFMPEFGSNFFSASLFLQKVSAKHLGECNEK